MTKEISRRSFICSTACGGLFFGTKSFSAGKQVVDLLNPNSPLIMPPNFTPSIWFTMESNGRTTVHILKSEIGQHVGTAFAQIVAEQLCLKWDNVTIDYPDMDHTTFGKYGAQMTGGSYSIHEMFDRLGRTAAVARTLLLETGADLMGSEIEDCKVVDSKIVDDIFEQEISFSEILSETTIDYEIIKEDLEQADLIERASYKIIGQSVKALDIPEKVNGSGRYGIDAFVPNMLYAKVIVPPTRLGSSIISIDDSEAVKVDGYINTLPIKFPKEALIGGFIVDVPLVVARNYPAALRASKLVKIQWSLSENHNVSSDDLAADAKRLLNDKGVGKSFFRVGNFKELETTETKKIEASFETGMVAHVPLEPANAMARFADGILHIYAGHQAGSFLPNFIGQYVGIAPENIRFHPHLVGGGFGKKFEMEAIILASIAAIQSKAPIKLIFTREDDMAFAHPRSPTVQHLTAVFDDKKASTEQVLGLKQEIAYGAIEFGDLGLIKPIVDGKAVESEHRFQIFSLSGADHWYDIPNVDVISYNQKLVNKVVPVRAVRSVSNNYTVFALESFIDEIAHELEIDPLNMRLNLLKGEGINSGDGVENLFPEGLKGYVEPGEFGQRFAHGGGKRLANVLQMAAGFANYGARQMDEFTAHGIAVAGAEERSNPSFTACIAEVYVNPNSADIDVKKLTIVIDVGLIVNPRNVRAQVEGSIIWGLSNCLYEEMTLEKGSIVQRNFDEYKWQNIMDLPEIDIHVVENGLYPTGAGEPATSIISPAIANAVYNAVGVRLRKLPLDREFLLSQL